MLPLRSCLPALLLLSPGVYCSHRPMDPASLVDWRYSCLCPELIPSVTEKSIIFVQELSFPQTAPTDDAFFQPGTGLERVGVVGLEQDCWQAKLEDAGLSVLWQGCCNVDWRARIAGPLCRNQEEGGSARASPVAAPMPKSVSLLEKIVNA